MKNIGLLFCTLLLVYNNSNAQCLSIEPKNYKPTLPDWEVGYKQREKNLLYADTWNKGTARGDDDNGKRYWPLLLGEMAVAKDRNDLSTLTNLINTKGRSGVMAFNEGTLNKPFSAPGLLTYFYGYRDKLPADQLQRIRDMWFSVGRRQTSRPDGNMDPIYKCSEFNSENFNWMNRTAGYLLSHEFDDNEPLTVVDHKGDPTFGDGESAKPFFANYIKNWVLGTYCTGRVEWGSHVYSGFCLQAAAVLHEYAKEPLAKNAGKAIADWVMAETAVRYLDGALVGPESRNKGGGFKPLEGSIWPYNYLYFMDKEHMMTGQSDQSIATFYPDNEAIWTAGFPYHFSYRPAQQILDIAHRKFKTPIEMHNVKPFYHVDEENYKEWRGNTKRGRKYEFETQYIEKNYTLASVASYRPNGKIGTFSEHCTWRLGVKGEKNGAVQIFGNSGDFTSIAGRNPYEEISQYRNIMMRQIKGGTKTMWVAVPKDVEVKEDGYKLFLNLGSGVYAALLPNNHSNKTKGNYNAEYYTYTWSYNPDTVGTLVMEVGTVEEHGSFMAFVSNINNKAVIKQLGEDVVEYQSASNHTLKMEFMPTTTYEYMQTNCTKATIDVAGVTPKAWGDGVYLNYENWNSYEVVFGEKIMEQKWGSATLTLHTEGKQLEIKIDTTTGMPTYCESVKPAVFATGHVTNIAKADKNKLLGYELSAPAPNPVTDDAFVSFSVAQTQDVKLSVYNIIGQEVAVLYEGKALANQTNKVILNGKGLLKGIYFVRLKANKISASERFTVLK